MTEIHFPNANIIILKYTAMKTVTDIFFGKIVFDSLSQISQK